MRITERQLRRKIRKLLKEMKTYQELQAGGHPASAWNFKKANNLEYWTEDKFAEWVKIKYSDDPDMIEILLGGDLKKLEAQSPFKAGKGRVDTEEWYTAKGFIEDELAAIENQYVSKPRYNEDLDFPESELPKMWAQEYLKKHDWLPGHGFEHKKYKDKWVNLADLPGLEDIGLMKTSFGRYTNDPSLVPQSKKKRESGRKAKQKFAKVYDQNREFFDNLYYVHWRSNVEAVAKFVSNPSSRDEISTTWFLDTPLKGGTETYGVLLHGRPTYVSNGNLYSGYATSGGIGTMESEDKDQFIPAWWKDMPHRTKSSGVNKYPEYSARYISGEQDVDLAKQDTFRKQGFVRGGSTNNEAIMDNWEPVAILAVKGKDDPNIGKLAKISIDNNIPLLDQNHDTITASGQE